MLFGASAVAAWAIWPTPVAFGVVGLVTADTVFRLRAWIRLVDGDRGRLGRIGARTATAATAMAVLAGALSPGYWSPAAGAALCARPTVQQGADDVWPDARPLTQRDSRREDSAMLDAAEEFEGNAGFGTAAWWVPLWGGVATGNSTSVAMVDVDGIGVYDADDGRVRWTLESGIDGAFGRRGDDGQRSIHGDRVHALGETLLVHLSPDRGRGALPKDALLAFDMETGERLWCAVGFTSLQVDPDTHDRIAVFDGSWNLLNPDDGRTVATLDIDQTSLAHVAPEESRMGLFSAAYWPTEQAVLGGGRIVLTRGPAIAVYDSADGSPIHDATLPAPAPSTRALDEEDGHAVYNVILDEAATVVEVDSHDSRSSRNYQGTELIAFDPSGEELWHRTAPEPGADWSLALGDYGLSGVVQVVDGVFAKSDRAFHISDGSDAWEPEYRIGLPSGSRHVVRDGFLYGHAYKGGRVVAVDARNGDIAAGPLKADEIEQGADVFLSHTGLPSGNLFTQSVANRPAETVMFGLPSPAD
ncbi:hypothetical protein KGD82_12950 [Nocardiopsis eucommiae]|uniref:Pyrrolo-quinoline quinone repeat domain-containing protein n=1 Tax=Nocardiopsis eucommiae TaxID=2831970 RepID=A0A975LCA8_9ACTN|nr:hypothetical protein KGD82_12950 [Nocardiopsis eucommiae]